MAELTMDDVELLREYAASQSEQIKHESVEQTGCLGIRNEQGNRVRLVAAEARNGSMRAQSGERQIGLPPLTVPCVAIACATACSCFHVLGAF